MSPTTIRAATPADQSAFVDRLYQMLQHMVALGGHPLAEADDARDALSKRLAELMRRNDHVYLVASIDDAMVGILEASQQSVGGVFRAMSLLHIHSVFVDPDQRRQGIGRQLIDAALRWGRARGCTLVELNVLRNNPARELYSAMGFDVFQLQMTRPMPDA